MDELLRAARKAGFTTWGFTPHAPICIESPCNMKAADVPAYLAEIEGLRRLNPDIRILAGMEVDYFNPDEGPGTDLVKSYGLDYVIGSVHFIPNQEGIYIDIDGSASRFRDNLARFFHDDLDYVVRTFWKQSQDMIRIGGFDIIGHIDKIALNASAVVPDIENTPFYRELADQTIQMAIKSGMAVEINTKHYERYGRFYPHPRFWQQIASAGVPMPINTDTHEVQGILSGYHEAQRLIHSYFITETKVGTN